MGLAGSAVVGLWGFVGVGCTITIKRRTIRDFGRELVIGRTSIGDMGTGS